MGEGLGEFCEGVMSETDVQVLLGDFLEVYFFLSRVLFGGIFRGRGHNAIFMG